MRFLIAMLAFLAVGCNNGPSFQLKPRQDEAMRKVWVDSYGMTVVSPSIGWFDQHALTCNVGPDGKFDGFAVGNDCVWGVTWTSTWQIWVSHPDLFNSYGFHYTFAHELWHAALFVTTGDSDPGHLNPGFETRYGHPPGGAVELANDAIGFAGL